MKEKKLNFFFNVQALQFRSFYYQKWKLNFNVERTFNFLMVGGLLPPLERLVKILRSKGWLPADMMLDRLILLTVTTGVLVWA